MGDPYYKLRCGLGSRHLVAAAAAAAHVDYNGLCLLVEDEPLNEVESRDRIFDRRVPLQATMSLLDKPAEILFRPRLTMSYEDFPW